MNIDWTLMRRDILKPIKSKAMQNLIFREITFDFKFQNSSSFLEWLSRVIPTLKYDVLCHTITTAKFVSEMFDYLQ